MVKNIALAFFAIVLLSGCSSSSKGRVANNSEVRQFEKEIGDRVFFAYNISSLSPDAKTVLTRQATWLKDHPSYNVTIEGHADERGTRDYNLALGERRAASAQKFLIHHGVNASRIETISYGKERPAVIGNDEAAWSKNRRAVTVLK